MVKQAVKIPVSVKISPFYTNTLNFIKKADEAGADACVLFNRFFQPEIDINKMEYYFPWELTQPQDHNLSLRYAGLLYGNLEGSISISRGLYTSEDVIRVLLAGADTVQIVSTIYKNQPPVVSKILEGIQEWMEQKKFSSISEFRGLLSRKNMKDPFIFMRAQYVDILAKSESIFRKYPMI
jgi:dihydroorotate dehydrogenase (fumarate)